MNSSTPRTDALYATDFHRWDGEPPDASYHRMTDHARELERELGAATARVAELEREPALLKAIFRQSCEEMRAENARLQDRLATITDRDLSPDRRSGANYWRAQYFESRRDIANANRGIARLHRRLEGAKERIASLNSDAAMLREEKCWLMRNRMIHSENAEAHLSAPGGRVERNQKEQ